MSNAGAGPADGDAGREEAYARFARIRVQTSPPPNELPGILPIGQFLGRSATVAAVLLEIHAYAAGLEFRLTYRGRAAEHHPPITLTDPGLAKRIGLPVGTPPQVEVLLPDATQAVAIGLSDAARRLETPGQVLVGPRGGGGNDQFDADYWLTPNPRCALTFRFTWPEQNLPTTTLDLDEQALHAATAAAVTLWPWDLTADVWTPG